MNTCSIEFRKISAMVAMVLLMVIYSCGGLQKPSNEKVVESTVDHPQWSHNANIYEVNVRQYTPEGTFNAFGEHLPRLKEMGIDILWFMPVTPIGIPNRKGTFGSYYSVQDYTAINPEFGTIEEFKELVRRIHEQDMYVIIDWVANHTAWDHEWVETHPEFYYHDENGNFTPPHDTDWTDVVQLDYTNKQLWDAMIKEMMFWVEEVNIDGFRCDVAYKVPTEFWNQARQSLESVKPVFMLAEADSPELMVHAFNAGYSWTSHHAINRIAKREDDVTALDKYYFEDKMGNYPVGAYKINFIDNHDENSWAGTVFERLGDGMEAFAVLVNTAQGMPLMYNGQEAGLNKRLEFFEKDQIDWSELTYEPFFKKLLDLKHRNKALWNGTYGGEMQRIGTNNNVNVFSFLREKDNQKVFVVLNLSPDARTVEFGSEELHLGTWTELFTNEKVDIGNDFSLQMQPWGYKVYFND